MRSVAQRTEQFEQNLKASSPQAQANPTTPASAPTSTLSAEDRLKKLNDLFKSGLITQAEYDAKKKEILKDM